MKYIYLYLFLSLIFNFSLSQTTKLSEIDGSFAQIAVDKFGNIYSLQNNILRKYDKQGKILFSFSDRTKGNINHFDVSNTLKILVNFPDIMEIVFLDNTLSPSGNSVSLRNLNLFDVNTICSGIDNSFWVYDIAGGKFIRFSYSVNQINKSGDIRLIASIAFNPVSMAETNMYLLAYDKNTGIIVLDRFANHIKTITINEENIKINNHGIFFIRDNKIISFDCEYLKETELLMPKTNIVDYYCFPPFLLIQDKEKLILYKIY